jgi:lantibiotic leader peptide-processing serine protease
MRTLVAGVAIAATVAGAALAAGTPASASGSAARSSTSAASSKATDYIVLADSPARTTDASAAVAKAGGTVVSTNADLGYVVARSSSASFAGTVDRAAGVIGAARNRIIGEAPKDKRASREQIEQLRTQAGPAGAQALSKGKHGPGSAPSEPLAGLQWDMRQIDATPAGSYKRQPGSKKVLVGIIDTGIDGSHPDIAPNFSKSLSRNFTTDIPDIDNDANGACEHPPACVDPVDEDDDGHGTHVASTIGSPINGLGIAGVAPNVTLVNIRAGQDSGYFFLKSTLDALTYAGKIGVDVVNMSYYTDPWLYNCLDNPADSPAEQAEQRTARIATQRAITFARNKGVLPVAALGNEATDLNNPTSDDTSPDYPADAAKERTIDNSCITVPTETNGVVAVSATGPSTRKAYYSNWSTQEADVAAPGGDVYDTADNTRDITKAVPAAYPKSLAELNGDLNPDGTPSNPAVVRSCKGSVCGYYQYLQGTSMASPHAAGVAALIVSEYGHRRHGGGFGLSPSRTERVLYRTAVEHACPTPRTYHYTRITPAGPVVESDATCEGSPRDNAFYGHGIVNALAAVR